MTTPLGSDDRPPHARDAAEDRTVLWVLSGVFAGAYAIGSVIQAAYVYGHAIPGWSEVTVWQRAGANAAAVAMLLVALGLYRQHLRARPRELLAGVVLTAAAVSLVRVVAQVAVGVYPGFDRVTTVTEVVAGFVIGVVSCGVGTSAMVARRGQRAEARSAERAAVERALAVRALEDEEVRVRREVADGLHATVQQRLVMLAAQVGEISRRVRSGAATTKDADVLDEIVVSIDEVREQDVRGVSHLLYPDRIEVGLVPAVRAMLRRVPASVATSLDIDPAVRVADDPAAPRFTSTERLLAARVVEEGVGNALRHGRPSRLAVSLRLADDLLTVTVENDGSTLPAGAVRHGTARLAERLAVVQGEVELAGIDGVGVRLVGRLPVDGVAEL